MAYSRFSLRGILNPTPFGARLIKLAVARGDYMADKLAVKLGVSTSHLRALVRGERALSAQFMKRVAAVYSLNERQQLTLAGKRSGIDPAHLTEVACEVRSKIQRSGLSLEDVRRKAGLGSATLSNLVNGKTAKPNRFTVAQIESALK